MNLQELQGDRRKSWVQLRTWLLTREVKDAGVTCKLTESDSRSVLRLHDLEVRVGDQVVQLLWSERNGFDGGDGDIKPDASSAEVIEYVCRKLERPDLAPRAGHA